MKREMEKRVSKCTNAILVYIPIRIQAHKKTHNPDQIPCDICSNVFISSAYMQAHKSSVHVSVACPLCSKTIMKGNLQVHKMKHEGRIYKCKHCSKSYMDQGSLSHHRKVHFPDNAKCTGCSQVFDDKQNMAKHFKSKHILLVHSTKRNMSCDKCPKLFLTQSSQRQHLRKVHKSRKMVLSCNQCDKVYVSRTGIKDHMVRVHEKELNFQCKYCDKRFKVGRVLIKHMKDLHEQAYQPIPCNVCAEKLSGPEAQKVHNKSHIEFERIMCGMCPKMFKPSGLASHAKSHKLNLVTCDVCNKCVKNQSALTKHKRVHTPQIKEHRCGMCGQKFLSLREAQVHQVTHTTEKPYKCSYPNCSNSYNNSGSRYHHIANNHWRSDKV